MKGPIRLLLDPRTSADLKAELAVFRDHQVTFDMESALIEFDKRIVEAAADDGASPDFDVPDASGAVGQAAGQLTTGKLIALLTLAAGVAGVVALGTSARSPGTSEEPLLSEEAAYEAPDEIAQRIEPSPDAGGADESTSAGNDPSATPSPEATSSPKPAAPRPRTATKPKQELPPTSTPHATPPAPELSGAEMTPGTQPADTEPASDSPAADVLGREVAQLSEVRRALADDPHRAFELAQRGHAEFRKGFLYQEREALALRALDAIGDRSTLEARGQAFLLRYPKSSFAREVERLLTK